MNSSIQVFDNNHYRGVFVPKDWKITSDMKRQQGQVFAKKTSLENVLLYKNDAVVRKIAQHFSCEITHAEAIFIDLKQFLWMATSELSNARVIPSPVIDEAWHIFVLFTQDYEKFCQESFGNFVHHFPHSGEEEVSPSILKETIDTIHAVFGKIPSLNWHYTDDRSYLTNKV